jgi:hypothetical protein
MTPVHGFRSIPRCGPTLTLWPAFDLPLADALMQSLEATRISWLNETGNARSTCSARLNRASRCPSHYAPAAGLDRFLKWEEQFPFHNFGLPIWFCPRHRRIDCNLNLMPQLHELRR